MKKPQKIQETRCAHKGCTTMHKSSTGYCAEHAHEMEKGSREEPQEGRACWAPMLHEERGRGDY